MSTMRPGVDDGGVLLLQHDGRSWVMLNLSGQAAYRNDELPAHDAASACDWAHDVVTAIVETAPPRPGNIITGVRCYTFQELNGVVHAELSAGRVHHDGQGWVLVDGRGEVTSRNDSIPHDGDAALDWANKVAAGIPQPTRRGRWRVSVGRFQDGTYYDVHGRLGRQPLRRAWNRMLTWAGAPSPPGKVIIVQLTPAPDIVNQAGAPPSSSSMPTVMAGMLEALDLQPGHRVLEIGTGTGHNAALLCHRVGPQNVVSVELDPSLADAARRALAGLRLNPAVHAGDGSAGLAAAAPFDRIIATAAADHIPPAWISQLAPGGVILIDLRGSLSGSLLRLTAVDWDTVESCCASWRRLGEPNVEQFGVTAYHDAVLQYVWFDNPDSLYRWPLPL
ncbi:MAG: methyltransferase domain-containing protein [Pseudonocardiales bacterium]